MNKLIKFFFILIIVNNIMQYTYCKILYTSANSKSGLLSEKVTAFSSISNKWRKKNGKF